MHKVTEDFSERLHDVIEDATAMWDVEDPVIFYPVSHKGIKGGLIITAWGDEAHDPLVLNEKKN